MCIHRRQQGGAHLGVLEDVHDEYGEAQPKDVGHKAGVEIRVRVLLQAAGKGKSSVTSGLECQLPKWNWPGTLSHLPPCWSVGSNALPVQPLVLWEQCGTGGSNTQVRGWRREGHK